jgi:hypothetical protein
MNHLIRTVTAAIVMALIPGASLVSAQAQKNVSVPAAQRALSNIVSKYSELYDAAPNDIQQKKVASKFRQEFCANIPRGSVSGWIGGVTRIDDNTPDKGINLDLEVSTGNLRPSASGALGIELSLGNSDGWVVSNPNAHPPTFASTSEVRIRVGSPLYNTASMLRSGDTVAFGGAFVPFSSPQACYATLGGATYFSLFRFSSIRKIGSDLTLE